MVVNATAIIEARRMMTAETWIELAPFSVVPAEVGVVVAVAGSFALR
jgi:hypothetical protein